MGNSKSKSSSPPASVNVWIAAHICTQKDIEWLIEAIKSTGHLNVYISISFENSISLEDLDDSQKLNISKIQSAKQNISLVLHKSRLSQFDHLDALWQRFKLYPDDFVIFLDHDDLLVNLNEFLIEVNKMKRGCVGLQYIGLSSDEEEIFPENETLTADNFSQFLIIHKDNVMVADDFSGTTLKYKYVNEYFANRQPSPATEKTKAIDAAIRALEDTKFMNFVEMKRSQFVPTKVPNPIEITTFNDGSVTFLKIPNAFRRMHDSPQVWKKTVIDGLHNAIEALTTLSEH